MTSYIEPPWWKTLYDQNLADILMENASTEDAENTLLFLENYAKMKAGDSVFDQCCGTGRLTALLAKKHNVIGVDLIPEYIVLAEKKLKKHEVKADLFCADAMQFSTEIPVDIAINWWTSFGYAEDDATNSRMLQRAYTSLKPGGRFVIDFMNVPGLHRHFQPSMVNSIIKNGKTITLERISSIDFKRDVLLKDWNYSIEGQAPITRQSEVKLYSPAQLITLLSKVGFINIQLFGDLSGAPLNLDSPRCIVMGEKP